MAWPMESPGLWIVLSLALYGLACAVEQGVRLLRRLVRSLRDGAAAPLTLVVLVRNQQDQVEGFVRELSARLSRRAASDWVCFLVDLASTDETPAILERLERDREHIRVIHLPRSRLAQALDTVLMLGPEGVLLLADLQAPAPARKVLQRLEKYW
ncbi:MAG TPA: glycosyltransferase [Symbiobacteriaceae bacterium]